MSYSDCRPNARLSSPAYPLSLGNADSSAQESAVSRDQLVSTPTVEKPVAKPTLPVHASPAVTMPALQRVLHMHSPRVKNPNSKLSACMIGILMVGPAVVAVGTGFVGCLHDERTEHGALDGTADKGASYAKSKQPVPGTWLELVGEFTHVFSTCFYAVAAPVGLMTLIAYHWRHRRRIPRICICLLFATLGALIYSVGWLLGCWWLCGTGLTFVAGSHAVTIAIEHVRNVLRTFR